MRFALGLEYLGTAYHGWQYQHHANSVQAELEQVLSKIANEPVSVVCAGRTDSGVHATEQVVHFDTQAHRSLRSWALGANTNLPDDIAVGWILPVEDDFHARYSAYARHYDYWILNRPTRPAIKLQCATWHHHPLDERLMHEAAQCLIGEHDFSSFRAAGCQSNSPNRNLHYIKVSREGQMVRIQLGANAFLHHMVRNIVGVLMPIGRGEKPIAWCKEVLGLRDRTLAGITAPPQGLYLTAVDYPDKFGLTETRKLEFLKG